MDRAQPFTGMTKADRREGLSVTPDTWASMPPRLLPDVSEELFCIRMSKLPGFTRFYADLLDDSSQENPNATHGVIGTTFVQESIEDLDARLRSSAINWNIVPGVPRKR